MGTSHVVLYDKVVLQQLLPTELTHMNRRFDDHVRRLGQLALEVVLVPVVDAGGLPALKDLGAKLAAELALILHQMWIVALLLDVAAPANIYTTKLFRCEVFIMSPSQMRSYE